MSADSKPSRGRLIFLSQLYDPEPTFKGAKFIDALQESGFDIEVVTGFPNYPGGQVYDGYSIKPVTREVLKNTNVTRLAIYPSHDRNALKRMLCYFSFFVSSFLYLTFRAKKADLIYVSYPSLTAGLAAVGAKLFRRTPILLDVQDMWPDSLGATGMVNSGYFLKFVGGLCRFLYRQVDHIVVQSEGFRKLLIERGVPAEKLSVILNWADESLIEPSAILAKGFDRKDQFRILFAGNLGTAQGLDTIIDAAKIVSGSHDKVVFYFLGSGLALEGLKAKANSLQLENVRFLPRVTFDEARNYLAAADCLLVHLNSAPLFKITIPSKTQAYMYAGKPIIMAVEGDAAELVLKAGAGLTCLPGNPVKLAEAVVKLIDLGPKQRLAMGKAGREYYDRELSMENHVRFLLDVIATRFGPGS